MLFAVIFWNCFWLYPETKKLITLLTEIPNSIISASDGKFSMNVLILNSKQILLGERKKAFDSLDAYFDS